MGKKHYPLYLDPKSAAALVELAKALNIRNQRNEHSISALNEWLGRCAQAGMPETVAALEIAIGVAIGGQDWDIGVAIGGQDWDELTDLIRPEWPNN